MKVLIVISTELQLIYAYELVVRKNINLSECLFVCGDSGTRLREIQIVANILEININFPSKCSNKYKRRLERIKYYRSFRKKKFNLIISASFSPPYNIYDSRKLIVSNAFLGNKTADIYEVPEGVWNLFKNEVNYPGIKNKLIALVWAKLYGYDNQYLRGNIISIPFISMNSEGESPITFDSIKYKLSRSFHLLKSDNEDNNKVLIFGQPFSEHIEFDIKLLDEVEEIIRISTKYAVDIDYYPHSVDSMEKKMLLRERGVNVIDRSQHGSAEMYYLAMGYKYLAIGAVASTCLFSIYTINQSANFFYFGTRLIIKNEAMLAVQQKYKEVILAITNSEYALVR